MGMPDHSLRAKVERHRAAIVALARRHNAEHIALFGSVARGDAGDDSDIDFLVTFAKGASLFDQVALHEDLALLLKHKVDVVSAGGLKASDGHILQEAIAL